MPTMSQLDPGQVVKSVYDATNQAIQVNVVATAAGGASVVKITDGSGSGNNVTVTASDALKVDGSAVTQPVSFAGSVTVVQPTGTNLHAVIDSGTITLSGTSPVSGTVTANQGTANATPWNENIAQFGGTSVSLGSHVSASSMPVVIASDQAAIPVTGTFFQATQPVSAVSLPLPTGASTSANQTTANSSLSSIDSKTPALGQALAAASVPVVLTAAQLTTLTPLTTISQKAIGYTLNQFIRNDYTSTAVTTSAYVQLIASTSNIYEELEIFDSSGQTLKLAFGGSGSEVDQFLIFPGGNGRILHHCPVGTRISIEAVSANATVGEIDLNLRG